MVHINHLLLSTQVTALTVKNDIIFIGEGQHLHVHNINTGAWLSSVEVFRAAVIHGIQFHSSLVCQGDVWRAAVFGQKSLAVLWFDPRLCLCRVLLEERHFDDWIVDAAWEDDASHVVLALAHNSLLRYQIQNLVESIKVKSVYESNQRGANSKSLEAQDKMVDPREENTCFHYDRTSQMSVLKAGHRSDTQRQKLSIYHKRDRFIVATAESSEKCVLFCGRVVMMSGSWESAVLLAGMVSQQLVVWGAWGDTDDNGTIVPLHSLIGHQGSIFSVNFCHDQKVITTTSDDRSIIVWDIIPAQKQSDKESHPTSAPMDPEQERHYWRGAHIVQKLKCYGHSARVWRSLILSSCILSVGEDSKVCVWDHEGTLLKSWKAHDGSSIWSIAATECQTKVITGGGDGSVKSWSLNTKSCSAAESLVDLPWTAEVPRSSDEVMNKKSLQMENFTNNFRQENEDYEPSSDEDTHIESSNCKTLMKDKMKILKKSEGQGKLKGDFPRCVSLLGLNNYLVVMDSGKLYCWMKNSASWCLSCEDKRLENYVVMEACPDQKLVAIGTLCGDVIILGLGDRGIMGVLLEEKVCEGKVFGLTWLAQDHLLVCGAVGVMSTWRVHLHTGELQKEWSYILPACKQRWVSAACTHPITPAAATHKLICGDRAGSLHLYIPDIPQVQHTLRSIHGRNGVTSLTTHASFVYSSGRDGCVRCLTVKDGLLQVVTVSRVSGVNWVAKLLFIYGRPLAVCFHDVKLKVWSVQEDRSVVEVDCGGGHRSWDLRVSEGEDKVTCLFLKDGRPYTFHTTLKDKLLPVIKTAVNTHETTCVQVLFLSGRETVFVTGGEDTTVRLHSVWGSEMRKALSVIRSHISSVRAICLIDGRGKNSVNGDPSAVWMVSAGGRAQLKVWKVTLSKYTREQDVPTGSDMKAVMDNNVGRLEATDVVCREVTSHMLRTGSNKTWKSQELTFDPETRYMGAAAFWVTETQAILALASSDGLLRIFQFDSEREVVELVCWEQWDQCVLEVTTLMVPHTSILVSTTTAGSVIFSDIQAVVNWIHEGGGSEGSAAPPPLQVSSVAAHQSGVNCIAFNYHTDGTMLPNKYSVTMATGGDDNKLSIWEVLVDISGAQHVNILITNICNVLGHSAQITGLHWLSRDLLVSASIDQRVVVWKLQHTHKSSNEHHAGNTTELDKPSLSTLQPVCSRFTGVPDVKGIAVVERDVTVSHTRRRRRIIVYGMGLQVFELHLDDD